MFYPGSPSAGGWHRRRSRRWPGGLLDALERQHGFALEIRTARPDSLAPPPRSTPLRGAICRPAHLRPAAQRRRRAARGGGRKFPSGGPSHYDSLPRRKRPRKRPFSGLPRWPEAVRQSAAVKIIRLWPAPAASRPKVIEGWICWVVCCELHRWASTSAHPRRIEADGQVRASTRWPTAI